MRRVQEDLKSLFSDGDILEIMALMPKTGMLDLRTDNLEVALDFVQKQDAAGATGIYVGTNPLKGRCGGPDKTRPNNQSVIYRRSLYLDFDRAEASKHLATHDELASVRKARQHAQDFLETQLGFPANASRSGVTGNGEYLIYQIDRLPNDAETNTLIKRALSFIRTIIAAEYPTVKLDTVTDAVRVRRISGTINRKHDDHRMCVLDVRDQKPLTREMLESLAALAPVEERTTSAQSVSLSLDDQDIIERLQRKEKYRALLAGDKSGYPDYSSARWALASKLYWEHADEEQIERILRASDLFKESDSDRQRDHVTRFEARKRASEGGPQRDPNYSSGPRLIAPPTEPEALEQMSDRDKDATIRRLEAQLQDAQATIIVLRERVRRADEREAVYKNTKLGAPRQVGAALVTIFQDERPRDPDSLYGFRMPLAKLEERTGLSPDACSRQLKKLSEYRTDDDQPVLHVETRDIPRTIDQSTGEIIEPHKEIWVGPGIEPSAFGRVLASLAPTAAPKHGGAPDRNVCPDHPDAGTVRRVKTIRRIKRECVVCHKELSSEDIEIGREESTYIRPTPHDAFAPEPDAGTATPHDAFVETPSTDPIPQDAASTGIHIPLDLSSKMPGRSSPSPGWEDERRRAYGQSYRGEVSA